MDNQTLLIIGGLLLLLVGIGVFGGAIAMMGRRNRYNQPVQPVVYNPGPNDRDGSFDGRRIGHIHGGVDLPGFNDRRCRRRVRGFTYDENGGKHWYDAEEGPYDVIDQPRIVVRRDEYEYLEDPRERRRELPAETTRRDRDEDQDREPRRRREARPEPEAEPISLAPRPAGRPAPDTTATPPAGPPTPPSGGRPAPRPAPPSGGAGRPRRGGGAPPPIVGGGRRT